MSLTFKSSSVALTGVLGGIFAFVDACHGMIPNDASHSLCIPQSMQISCDRALGIALRRIEGWKQGPISCYNI